MKLLTILQAFALLILAVIGASASDPEAGACPANEASLTCDL